MRAGQNDCAHGFPPPPCVVETTTRRQETRHRRRGEDSFNAVRAIRPFDGGATRMEHSRSSDGELPGIRALGRSYAILGRWWALLRPRDALLGTAQKVVVAPVRGQTPQCGLS